MALAESLRELADNSSEVALRNALSRSYYSIYHAAIVLVGTASHGRIVKELSKIDSKVGEAVKRLQELRVQADYHPDFVERIYGGDLESFRLDVRKRVDEGRAIFRWVMEEVRRRNSEGQ